MKSCTVLVMAQTSSLTWATRVRALGITGGVLALISVICGVIMLILKWQVGHAPDVLSQIPLIVLPIAFVAFMAALWCAVMRRRAS